MPRCPRAASPGVLLAALTAWACGGDSAGPSATRFAFPLVGTVNETFFYVNYVDETPPGDIRDFRCGLKTYDGHRGTDITLPSFAVMDAGVPVVAAAAGTVIGTWDQEFDRQRTWTTGAVWNYVAIRHADGLQSIYGHLKKSSVVVRVGQAVQAGTVLGQVGSSGISDMPHLHFEVLGPTGAVVDPWTGPCAGPQSRWLAQDPYESDFSLIASGLSNATLTVTNWLVKDPPPQVETFLTSDERVTMWVHVMNVAAGSVSQFWLYPPDGGEPIPSAPRVHPQFYSMSWWWASSFIPGILTQPGTWRMEYVHEGVVRAEQSFILAAPPEGPAAPPAARLPRLESGGGGLRQPGT